MDQVELIVVVFFVPLLFVLAVVAISVGQRGCRNDRDPMDRRVGGEPGRLQLNRNKWGSVLSVCVCLDVPPAFRFTLRREGLYDRLAKGLRLAREPQVAHGPFDDGLLPRRGGPSGRTAPRGDGGAPGEARDGARPGGGARGTPQGDFLLRRAPPHPPRDARHCRERRRDERPRGGDVAGAARRGDEEGPCRPVGGGDTLASRARRPPRARSSPFRWP